MHGLLPESVNGAHFFIGGNVTIHPSAVIASGVLLQADPDSQLRIAAGVSIGAGSILHAHQGILEVQDNVTIGSRVLIMGCGLIGQGACIGAATSILFEVKVAPQQVVAPGSLLEDPGNGGSPPPPSPAAAPPAEQTSGKQPAPPPGDPDCAEAGQHPSAPSATFVSSSTVKFAHVYGRTSVERLMQMMFHRGGPGQQGPESPAPAVDENPDSQVED
ncbi:MAG: hypothetical protein VKK04_02230 [Synechococcales bacterium]|nr:hypothetical protein [Synechococcales bacterium]